MRQLSVLACLALLIAPVAAELNTSVNPRIYFTEDVAVPFELWMILIGLGMVFLFLSWAGTKAIPLWAGMGMACFGAAAYAAPMVGYFNYEIIEVSCETTGTSTANVLPVVSLVTQPWVAWFLYGFAILCLAGIFRGFIFGMKAAAEQKKLAEIAEEETW